MRAVVKIIFSFSIFCSGTFAADVIGAANREIILKEYTKCAYMDPGKGLKPPTIYKMPRANCGFGIVTKDPKGICEGDVGCAAQDRPDAYFHVRCYTTDGKTCPMARECRDSNIEFFDDISKLPSGEGKFFQTGTSTGTSK